MSYAILNANSAHWLSLSFQRLFLIDILGFIKVIVKSITIYGTIYSLSIVQGTLEFASELQNLGYALMYSSGKASSIHMTVGNDIGQ